MNSITPWDRTRFEKKSSRELLELLRRDSQANSRQELDEEEILYILELLRSRGDLPETGDSREAWKSFVKNYRPPDGMRPKSRMLAKLHHIPKFTFFINFSRILRLCFRDQGKRQLPDP